MIGIYGVNKANRILGLIRRSFSYLDNKIFKQLFQALVRPHLEYASSVWSPHLKKDIKLIENVQKRATKLLPGMDELDYKDRLKKLDLPTLRYRRMRGDMIETYKILHNIYDTQVSEGILNTAPDKWTRGHNLSLKKSRFKLDVRKYAFTVRITDIWNNLPQHVVNAPSVKSFENRLDNFWKHQDIKFDFKAQYSLPGSRIKYNYVDNSEVDIEALQPASIEES